MASFMDGLQDKWERITPRERMLVVLLSATGLVLLLSWVGFTIRDGLVAIEKKNDKTREALYAMQSYRVRRAQGTATAARKVVFPDAPLSLETYLSGIAKDVGVTIPGYSSRPENQHGDFAEVSTKIEIRGLSILEVKDLLQAIETRRRGQVIVSNLHVKRQFRVQEKLDIDMVVSTFYKNPEDGDDDDDKDE